MKLPEKHPLENARSYALRVLLDNIINLELAPGSAVSEKELSLQMNLSRTPVREALIELSKLKLVEILPQRGSYITKIDYNLIEETRFMRMVLENAVVELACSQGMEEQYLESMKENLVQQQVHLMSTDNALLLKLDNDFHRIIFQSVNKMGIYEVIRQQMVHADRLRSLTIKLIQNEIVTNDHENIFYALKRRDGELAKMIMTRHLTRYEDEKSEVYRNYPDYFVTD
ncbi:GntR family transcriptional regulator [Clostridium sp. AN503]|uniref:GntR family transcriptional regulator n=1 Tax=Clostridium sp. AN503 TaxID=3160598 RepID=UPI003458B785